MSRLALELPLPGIGFVEVVQPCISRPATSERYCRREKANVACKAEDFPQGFGGRDFGAQRVGGEEGGAVDGTEGGED